MVSFWIYDVSFLILFTIGIFLFLKNRKDELTREGWFFMWRTQFGVRAIDWFTKKFSFILRKLKWVVIGIGGVLMAVMVWMLGQTVMIYLLHPEITKTIKAPPLAPLIPYFPKLFGMESFFPPFYFTYFIVALAIVAIAHEFTHGIYMRLFKVKIKSTGLVFLGPILGAFVEEEKTGFKKKKNSEQMTILAGGVFANVLMALLFYFLLVGFFFVAYAPSGYIFNSYAVTSVPSRSIIGYEDSYGFKKVLTDNGTFYLDDSLLGQIKNNESNYIIAYLETPAFLAQMKGAIIQADDVKILNANDLRWFLENKNPGDIVKIVTEDGDDVQRYDVMLAKSPDDSDKAFLGVGHYAGSPRGIVQKILAKFMGFRETSTYYKPIWNGEFVNFIYYLFWWIMLINLLVALFNMIPLGILDGGRFFYLAMMSISGSKKFAKKAYKIASYFILLLFLLMMIFWLFRII